VKFEMKNDEENEIREIQEWKDNQISS
jgi:hypothetical protein